MTTIIDDCTDLATAKYNIHGIHIPMTSRLIITHTKHLGESLVNLQENFFISIDVNERQHKCETKTST